jgi:hypothetical protein
MGTGRLWAWMARCGSGHDIVDGIAGDMGANMALLAT